MSLETGTFFGKLGRSSCTTFSQDFWTKIEWLCLGVYIRNKRILVQKFYQPPNSNQVILSNIQISIGLAFDTGITDIVMLGDFNLQHLKPTVTKEKKVIFTNNIIIHILSMNPRITLKCSRLLST